MTPAVAVWCRDAPDAPALREEHLEPHLAHIERIMDKLLLAGPLKDEQGAFTGSLLIFAVATQEEARALLEQDPYFRAEVWAEITLEPFLPVAGTLVGGRNW